MKYGLVALASVILAIASAMNRYSPTPGFFFTRTRSCTVRRGSLTVRAVDHVRFPVASAAASTCPPVGLNPGQVIATSLTCEGVVDTVVSFSVPELMYSTRSVRADVALMVVASISPE